MQDNVLNMAVNKISNNDVSSNGEFSLLQQIPVVLRARGFRLYPADGRRLVDLWLNGGAAILGHTPPNLLRELKNTASRGLYAPYPHFSDNRFLKALSKLFPQKSFRLYAAPPEELIKIFSYESAEDAENIKKKKKLIQLWRPYIDPLNPFAVDDTPILIPVIPGIQTWRDGLPLGLCVVVADEKLLSRAASAVHDALTVNIVSDTHIVLPSCDMLSPVLLAAATRGIYDLFAAAERGKSVAGLRRITKALRENSTKKEWRRNGIYLTLKNDPTPEEWAEMFHQFLDAGFLIPPTPSFPLILPAELSDGEEAKLVKAL